MIGQPFISLFIFDTLLYWFEVETTPSRPRPKSLPSSEVEICRRIGRVRKLEGLSQADLALRLGVHLHTLVAVENARISLKWDLGVSLCRSLNINQLWLAFGVEPLRPFIEFDPGMMLMPSPFSGVVLQIKPDLQYRQSLVSSNHPPAHNEENERRFFAMEVSEVSKKFAELVPAVHRLSFLNRLPIHLTRLVVDLPSKDGLNAKNLPISSVDKVYASVNNTPVNSPMEDLRERLNKATLKRGMKSVLAKALGVSLSNASQWLSGEREPGGETTLKMLKWVEQQERN